VAPAQREHPSQAVVPEHVAPEKAGPQEEKSDQFEQPGEGQSKR
jgi:hypothetical protein